MQSESKFARVAMDAATGADFEATQREMLASTQRADDPDTPVSRAGHVACLRRNGCSLFCEFTVADPGFHVNFRWLRRGLNMYAT